MRIERHEGVTTLTLDRPGTANSLTAEAVEELLRAVREAHADGTQTLVLTAAGANFCSGFDLGNLDAMRDADLLARFVRIELLLQALYMAPFDTVACAKGASYGAGADLFAACRARLADPGARFVFPGLQFGVALGTRRFAALVGETAAYELLAAGTTFDAGHAHKLGLATRVAREDEWPELIAQRHRSRRVKGEALSRLANLTRHDSCAQDMHALVQSASEPGLAERIRRYRDTIKAKPGSEP